MLKTKVIYVRQFWLLSGVWWYSEGEGVKSWDQSILKCGQRFWLSLFDMTCWQHWHFNVILLSWPHKATASNCEISVLLPNKMCTPDISESYPPLSSIFPDTPYLPMDVHFRVVHIFPLPIPLPTKHDNYSVKVHCKKSYCLRVWNSRVTD